MLYKYDNAIAEDLRRSFNPNGCVNPVVKVVDADGAIGLLAQIQNDDVKFPAVVLTRNTDTPIDKDRVNFTYMHRGVPVVIDTDTNELYYEKVIPIELSYDVTVLATNTADRDELVRELLFKYVSMYFIAFELPYESKRKIRFGLQVDPDGEMSNKSGSFDYIDGGQLYQTVFTLKCHGAVLVSYTPAKLQRGVIELELDNPISK